MNKTQFLNAESVQSFIKWITPKLDKSGSFKHAYIMKRPNGILWECDSIYSAFENYKWSFTCKHPVSSISFEGETFEECKDLLAELSFGLRESVIQDNPELCKKYCLAILEWGKVKNGNANKVLDLGLNIISYLKNCINRLNTNIFDTKDNYDDIIMSAGFSKIYSLLIDDFIIYDGRVGAALGLLVKSYCEEKGLRTIPYELIFAYGNAKGDAESVFKRRNASNDTYKFPLLHPQKNHTENNFRANWLLKEILDKSDSKFNQIQPKLKLRAFEASLFMIGYDVVQSISTEKAPLEISKISETKITYKNNESMKKIPTWGGRSSFQYDGSVKLGTNINFGSNITKPVFVSKQQYELLIKTFKGQTISMGTSRTSPPSGSVGEWLNQNVSSTVLASYVGAILVNEGYALKNNDEITVKGFDYFPTQKTTLFVKDEIIVKSVDSFPIQKDIPFLKAKEHETPSLIKKSSFKNFREAFPGTFRTKDGHMVRSKAEVLIDNALVDYGIGHTYERKLPIEENVLCDFFIESENIYIEYWGIENDPKYLERKKIKLEIYKKYNFKLIELVDDDIKYLDDILPKKLLEFGVNVY